MKHTILFIVLLGIILLSVNCSAQKNPIIKCDTFKYSKDFYDVEIKVMYAVDCNLFTQKTFESYYVNGQLRERIQYDLDGYPTGMYESFYSNGIKKETYLTVKGRPIGLYQSYFENGRIKVIGVYRDIQCYAEVQQRVDTIIDKSSGTEKTIVCEKVNAIKVGKWYTYTESGAVEKIDIYGKEGKFEDW